MAPSTTAAIATVQTVKATVYTDANGNASQDGTETGLSGVTVKLEDSTGTTVLQTATTDTNGNVSFTGMAAGSYQLAVTTPSGDVVTQNTIVGTSSSIATS